MFIKKTHTFHCVCVQVGGTRRTGLLAALSGVSFSLMTGRTAPDHAAVLFLLLNVLFLLMFFCVVVFAFINHCYNWGD